MLNYFTEQGPSHIDVVKRIKEKYGGKARILSHKSVRMGGLKGLFGREGVEISGYIAPEQESRKPEKKIPPEIEREKQKILNSLRPVKESATLEKLLEEIQSVKKQVSQAKVAGVMPVDSPNIKRIVSILENNDCASGLIDEIRSRINRDLSCDDLDNFDLLQDTVVLWLAERIKVAGEKSSKPPGRRLIALVGPTGVGKTTTIAKLAAKYSLGMDGQKEKSVRIISTDNYRIAARGQLQIYGDIMNIPVAAVESKKELARKIALFQDADVVLVDTTGRSPRDFKNLASLRELLEACGAELETYLVLTASTKASDMREILREYEPFKYNSIILTKLDETLRVGNVISVLGEVNKPISFITSGQGVPQDIEAATRMRLLKNLEGFRINSNYLSGKLGE